MPQENLPSPNPNSPPNPSPASHLIPASTSQSASVRYGLAISSVAIALAIGFLLGRSGFRGVEFPLFLMAIAITTWFAGTGPAIVALVLSALTFDYFFTLPIYSLAITRYDLPYYIVFVLFSLLLAWFTTIRRRVERDLRQSRDELQKQVAIRTQQANLLNLAHDPILVRDMDGVITYWNRGAEELYGWTAQQAIGKRTQDLLHSVFPRPFHEIRQEMLATGRWEGEVEKIKSDGTPVSVESRWSLQRDRNGHPAAILETESDITHRKRADENIRGLNQQLTRRSTELEATNKELEAFAYSISHDLRAPLRHMAGFAELLQKHSSSVMDDKARRYLAVILESAKRMGALIDDLLAFSRISRAEARRALVSLDQLVRDLQNEFQNEVQNEAQNEFQNEAQNDAQRGLEHEARREAGHEPARRQIRWKVGHLPDLYGDPSMLRLAFVNLISNAVKFTRTRPQAEIEIGSIDNRNGSVVVFVKDNGVGFDMKYVHKIFGVFQRLHRADEYEGTGIGLATVQRIIHRHGGEVWAEAQVDGGATFYLSLPKS